MAKNVTFTPASIDGLTKGKLRDSRTPGLTIEVLASGRKIWKYERRLSAVGAYVRLTLGRFPARTLADARAWAAALNEQVEAGVDPREAARAAEARASMTVDRAHQLYMIAVNEGRASRAKRKNRPRTIADKQKIYDRDVPARLKKRSIYAVTEKDLMDVVIRKGKTAKVRANRLAAELKVFFGWASSLRGLEVGLESDPSRRLGDLRFPEPPRSRKLSLLELEWFLKALVAEPRWVQRSMLLWLLTAARISEVAQAKSAEMVNGV